jgi:nicotinamide-nucleotide amidase
MRVEVLAVGTELLLGQIVNGNGAAIGARLADAGLDHHHQSVVGDNRGRVASAIDHACERSDALIITGGIGPTQDDLTREAIADAAGVGMVFDEEYAEALRERWRSLGQDMPESNLRQAYLPEGATPIENPKGTAPGVRMHLEGTWIFALPGVPAEMVTMLDRDVVPFLVSESGDGDAVVFSRLVRTWGASESKLADELGDLFEASVNPTIAYLASSGEIKVRISAKAKDETAARSLVEPVEAEIRSRLGDLVFATDDETVESVVLGLLEAHGWTMATAESMTGGLVAARLTTIPGASRVFLGGIVAYAASVKVQRLGVVEGTLSDHGPVSEAVAGEMAVGAASALGADVAVAVTGAAGPDAHDAPAGTVAVAVSSPNGVSTRLLRLPGDRERVRTYAATAALHLVRRQLSGS